MAAGWWAKARGKHVGRPVVVDKVDAELVARLRAQGRSWREIAEAHPPVKSTSGRKVRPNVGSIRRAWEAKVRGCKGENGRVPEEAMQ
jgi:hypothetical protein